MGQRIDSNETSRTEKFKKMTFQISLLLRGKGCKRNTTNTNDTTNLKY